MKAWEEWELNQAIRNLELWPRCGRKPVFKNLLLKMESWFKRAKAVLIAIAIKLYSYSLYNYDSYANSNIGDSCAKAVFFC